MKAYGGATSVLNGVEWSASLPDPLNPREIITATHWVGGWVGPRVDLEAEGKRKISVEVEDMSLN
jgi:hypothetical protein